MIHFDNVSKRYAGGHEALNGLSFEVADGEMVFVTGHSGAGKTTLLKLLGLIERPTRGEIVVIIGPPGAEELLPAGDARRDAVHLRTAVPC